MTTMLQTMQTSIDKLSCSVGCVADIKTSVENVTGEIRSLKESLTEQVGELSKRVEEINRDEINRDENGCGYCEG